MIRDIVARILIIVNREYSIFTIDIFFKPTVDKRHILSIVLGNKVINVGCYGYEHVVTNIC